MHELTGLKIAKFTFHLRATEPMVLPEFAGSTFRGAFGGEFKRVVCGRNGKACKDCLERSQCVYAYVFETPNPGTLDWFTGSHAPHPFIIEPPEGAAGGQESRGAGEIPREIPVGDVVRFNLVLVGKTIDCLPYFVYAFKELGSQTGLGKYRNRGMGRFRLETITDALDGESGLCDGTTEVLTTEYCAIGLADVGAPQDVEKPLRMRLLTPMRFKHEGRYVDRDRLSFPLFLNRLYERLVLLDHFHCGGNGRRRSLDPADVRFVQSHLRWRDWTRYSARQNTHMKFGGLVGDMLIEGPWAPYWPLLWMGQYVHIGQKSAFGNGKYRLETTAGGQRG